MPDSHVQSEDRALGGRVPAMSFYGPHIAQDSLGRVSNFRDGAAASQVDQVTCQSVAQGHPFFQVVSFG